VLNKISAEQSSFLLRSVPSRHDEKLKSAFLIDEIQEQSSLLKFG